MTAIKSFAQLERTGWEQVAHRYDEVWASLTKQFIPPLLKAAAMKSGMSVLDVACGPGYVAAEVKRLGATATGIDFSFEMVRQAQAMNPGIKFFEGDAQRLPFPAESFERVLMNFGLLHLPSPEEALAEACRVLRNKGRLAFTLWAKPEENPGAKIMEDAIEAHGDKAVKLPPGPPYFVYANSEECKKILRRV